MENNITMEVLSEQAMATVAVEPAVTPVPPRAPPNQLEPEIAVGCVGPGPWRGEGWAVA